MASQVMDPAAEAALLAAFLQSLKDTQISNYFATGSYAAMIYDIILTFPLELEFIWKERLTTGSLMYIFMRYGNVIEQGITLAYYSWAGAPFMFCKVWFYLDEWFAYSLFIPTTIIFGMRTYALYRDKGIFYKWLMIFLVLAMNAVMFISLGLVTKEIKWAPPPIPGMTCNFNIASGPYTPGLVQFIASTLWDASIFFLTLWHVIGYWKTANTRLINIIFRDSLFYYAILFFAGLATLLLYATLPEERAVLRQLLVEPMKAMSVIIASRIVLNLRIIVLAPGSLTVDTLLRPPDFAGMNGSDTLNDLDTIEFRGQSIHDSRVLTDTFATDTTETA